MGEETKKEAALFLLVYFTEIGLADICIFTVNAYTDENTVNDVRYERWYFIIRFVVKEGKMS